MSKVNQISETTDKALKSASLLIGEQDAAIEEATKTKEETWTKILELFDELNFTGPFYTEEGRTLMLQSRSSAPKLDAAKLERLMREQMGTKFNGLWNLITDKTVNTTALERAVNTGKIPGHIVDACIEQKTPTFARIRREFTKEDAEKAQVLFGIKVSK